MRFPDFNGPITYEATCTQYCSLKTIGFYFRLVVHLFPSVLFICSSLHSSAVHYERETWASYQQLGTTGYVYVHSLCLAFHLLAERSHGWRNNDGYIDISAHTVRECVSQGEQNLIQVSHVNKSCYRRFGNLFSNAPHICNL